MEMCIICAPVILILVIVLVVVTTRKSKPKAPSDVVAPGWYSDPVNRHELRFWDGRQWTSQVSDAGSQSVDPLS
jgi:hypothetical protein